VFKSLGLPEIAIIIAGAVILALLVAVIIWIISKALKSGNSSKTPTSPLEIARQRYAKGEITKEQFEQLKKDLS
jgi:putative membrane protein